MRLFRGRLKHFPQWSALRAGVMLALLFDISHLHATSASGNFVQQRAYGPVKLQFGFPVAAPRIDELQQVQLAVAHGNIFSGGETFDELLFLDAETTQLSIRYRRALNRCWQLNIDAQWLAHTGGRFDRALDDWHQFFGLPDANRSESPYNELNLHYVHNTDDTVVREIRLDQDRSGIGDMQLHSQYYVGCTSNAAIVRAGVKLPLGEPQDFTGSGEADYFMDWQSPWWRSHAAARSAWAISAGVLLPGNANHLGELNEAVGFGTAGLNFSWSDSLVLLAQLDWHTALFDSGLTELGRLAGQLTLGARYSFGRGHSIEMSFAEDVVVDTVPDIVVRFAWTRQSH